ncbi:O-antigen/teichoic acid export membrane protein [Herbaspirillum sp. Sphag1AN]|uniref:lipopolysaccharide biosynthesis protein n=1 Tax=unclassified Herbaspirillum TaxID=2624150 RepID=UPI001842DCB0|nr:MULTISPECIES: lipopolysaccharide biosynthesis protein [unclassified Herbaspirillum]MBB3211090.1 O-antigen/teichoic acid export membrane protein [Herbaspirillum sp. Sphag1AN]MBB3244719.1 O-antigen/teichoic acid export membrane protein [Herbaspirillum sp. Sphag64]
MAEQSSPLLNSGNADKADSAISTGGTDNSDSTQRSGGEGSSRRLLTHSLASLLDQVLLSGLNFSIGLTLIRMASKTTYGLYSQLFVAGIFTAAVIEALITDPLTTIVSGEPGPLRARLYSLLLRFQWQLSITLALLCGVASAILARFTGIDVDPLWLGLSFALYVFSNAQREYHRSISFIEALPLRVLRTDLVYALVVAGAGALLLLTHTLSVPALFAVMGVANIAGMWGTTQQHDAGIRTLRATQPALWRSEYRGAVGAVLLRGRWALPGALVAWATNYSYLYLAALSLGVAATADLNASRLLLTPISLSVLAWSRVARPLVTRLLAARDWKHLDRLAWASVAGIEVVTLGYVVVLWLMLPWLEAHILGSKYHGLEPLVLAWGGYFAINAARWIGSSWLTSNDQYKLLLISGVACLLVMLVATAMLIPLFGSWGAILALIVVEVFDLVLIWFIFLPMLRRKPV